MIAAVFTAWFFALSAILGAKSAQVWGAQLANAARLLVATILLGAFAFTFGSGLAGPGFVVFLLSGLVGFGIGDAALFSAYRHIGSRKTILLVQCLAVPFAGVVEWLWLGSTIGAVQIAWIVLILTGVSMVLMESPRKREDPDQGLGNSAKNPTETKSVRAGVAFGVLGAIGQAGGAVLTRRAVELNAEAGLVIDGATASFQRILGGILVALAIILWRSRKEGVRLPMAAMPRHIWPVIGNALAGPVFGVTLYQLALTTTPSGIVLAIVATTPVMILPMARWWENDRIGGRALAGSVLAVLGVAALVI